MTFALMYALVNLIIDVAALLDPRLRLVYE